MDDDGELPDLPRRRWSLVVVGVVVVLAVLGGLAFLVRRAIDGGTPPISVRVQANGVDETVEVRDGRPVSDALAEAGVAVHDGRLLSIRDHDVLDADLDPATITVDGRAAELDTDLADGAVVTVVDGKDEVEKTEVVPYDIAPAPYPPVMRHVQERGIAGKAEKVVGATSHEIVSRRTLKPAVDPVQTTRKVVALTFDDGPNETWTPQILQILKDKGVKATFCEIGENVARRPDLVRQVLAEGHQLCNHTLNHDEGLAEADQARLDAQIAGGHQAFLDADLPEPPYYRPPGGFLSDAITATAKANGEQIITWKVDPDDWRSDANVLTVIDNVSQQVDSGSIILLHDGGGKTRQATVDALGPLIDLLRSRGYAFTFPITDPSPK